MVMMSAIESLIIPKAPALPLTPLVALPSKIPPSLPAPNTPPPLPPSYRPTNPQNVGIYQKIESVLSKNLNNINLNNKNDNISNNDKNSSAEISLNYEETRKVINNELSNSKAELNNRYEETRKILNQSTHTTPPPLPPQSQKAASNQNQETSIMEERRITQKLVEGSKIIMRNESVRSKLSGRSVTSQRSGGFRLKDGNNNSSSATSFHDKEETGSVYSIYKQKIDSMFESDTSSQVSNNVHNSVQAKIEKMFSDVAKDSGIQPHQIGMHNFSVDYLGSIPLHDKVTSLDGLQTPLKDLYFSYKRQAKHKQKLSGRLEISSQGLKVQYQGETGDLEQMNSFPTIAVWSAVKFVVQEINSSRNGLTYAFLPLITDPDNMDKQMLFRNLEENEKRYIHSDENHSPLFAVVMRKFGVQKQLECHGFVCQTSEDAIVIAATLYKSLVSHMKNKERKPQNKNGLTTCMSTTSSITEKINGKDENPLPVRPPRKKRSNSSSVASDSNSIANMADVQTILDSQDKNPKRSTKARRAPKAPSPPKDDMDAILPYEEPVNILRSDSRNGNSYNVSNGDDVTERKPKSFSDKLSAYISKEQKQIAEELKKKINNPDKGLRHVDIKKAESIFNPEDSVRSKENSGDIFTKVTIPRSGSFLNTGGLTRYKSKISRNNDSTSGGSPLGFKEIFHELSLQEGLHSMDDILSVIIDPDGMSFNDLKPIYKEFLLKLAVTLTKDELYLKSKSIMRRQKKKQIKRSSSAKRSPNLLSSTKIKRLKHIFQKNLKIPPPASFRKQYKENPMNVEGSVDVQINAKLPESSIDSSSYDTRQFRTKEELGVKKQNYRKKSTMADPNKPRGRRDRTSTSEESDFFSLKRQQKLNSQNTNLVAINQNRNSSSGYVSCSECSYDSDTCTCTSADKCYCSLGQQKSQFGSSSKRGSRERCLCSEDLILCGCDTDSCAESNKCYCPYGPQSLAASSKNRRASHSNLKMHSSSSKKHRHRGCEEVGMRESTPHQHHSHIKHKKLCKKNSHTKSTKSLEYMSNPSETYYEKLRSKSKFGSERVGHTNYYEKHSLTKKRRNSHSGVNTRVETFEEMNLIALEDIQKDLGGGNNAKMLATAAGGKLSAMDYELLKLTKGGNIGDLENLRDYWAGTRSYENYKGNFNGRGGAKSIQSAITAGACTEALSVKKSAEMAAMFGDIKLSQTTDITHLTSQAYEDDSGPHSRIIYEKNSLQANYSKPIKSQKQSQAAIPYKPSAGGRTSNTTKNKSHLYSTRNGLYTIQSQSDESRRSSLSEGKKLTVSDEPRRKMSNSSSRYKDGGGRARSPAVDYIEVSPISNTRNMSSNIENSLGYLP